MFRATDERFLGVPRTTDKDLRDWSKMMLRSARSRFTLKEDSGKAEGSGRLFGSAWKWTYFKATYTTTSGVQVEDEKFLADESFGTARQKLTGPDGKVMMYMDLSLKSITPKTDEILRDGLMKK